MATLTYGQHDTTTHDTGTRITLPDQTLWISIPENAILHIDDLALYYLDQNQYESEMVVSEFFNKHTLELDPNMLTQMQYQGTQTIDLTPFDDVLKGIAIENHNHIQPINYAFSTPDTVLTFVVVLG